MIWAALAIAVLAGIVGYCMGRDAEAEAERRRRDEQSRVAPRW